MNQRELLAATLLISGVTPDPNVVDALFTRGVRVIDRDSAVVTAETLGQALHEELCTHFRPLHSHPVHSADAVLMNVRSRR